MCDPTKWQRPALEKPIDQKSDTLVFQQFDVDYYTGQPLGGMPGSTVGPVPILRIYGVDMDGHSITAHIHGFSPYFYVKVHLQSHPVCNSEF